MESVQVYIPVIVFGGHTYLKKVGFLWGKVDGFDADVADDSNVIRFYRKRDLEAIFKSEEQFRKLIESAKASRKKIPYAKEVKSKRWVLESGNKRVRVKEDMQFQMAPAKQHKPSVLKGQGAGIPSQTLF